MLLYTQIVLSHFPRSILSELRLRLLTRACQLHKRKVRATQRFHGSKRATALPVSFLMLFVSLTLIISATYYVSVTKIEARGRILNVAVAKQNMLYFEDSISSTKWSPGTSSVYQFEDSGSTFKTYPTAKNLLINITDDATFSFIAFNSSVGKALYALPSAEAAIHASFLKGDSRAVINQSAFTMAQLYFSFGAPSPELTLTYRPLATMGRTSSAEEKPTNILRLYIINLNTSESMTAEGRFKIKATCTGISSNVQTLNFTSPIVSLSVKATLDGKSDVVVLPVESNSSGALVKVELLVCSIELQRIRGGS